MLITDYTATTEYHQHETELAERVERRRVTAERAVERFGGERLALIAYLARSGRATRAVATGPAAC